MNRLTTQAIEALGWMYAEACSSLDNGIDIRKANVPDLIDRATQDLVETTKDKNK